MRWTKSRIRVILSLVGIALTMFLISMTIGKDLLNGAKLTLVSFAVINFAGYLFILLLPVEALIPLYIAEGYNGWILFVLAMSTLLLAQVINYTVGRLMSEDVIHGLIGEKKFTKYKNKINEYGPWTVVFFNVFPLASSVLSLVAGITRFKMKRLLVYTFIGAIIKYLVLIFFSEKILGLFS